MRVIGRIFASLFALVFILTLPVAMILYNVEAHLVSADTYKNVLVEQKIYDQAPQVAAGELMNYAATKIDPTSRDAKVLKQLTPDEIAKAISTALPTATVQPLVENLVDQIFSLINTGTGTITVTTTELKKAILTNTLPALHSIIDSKPLCTKQEMSDLKSGVISFCQPPKAYVAEMDGQLNKTLVSMTSDIPDSVTLLPAESVAKMQESLGYLSTARNAAKASLAVPLLALALIALFTVRSKRSWMRWWGVPMFIGGLLTLAVTKAAPIAAMQPIKEQIAASGFATTTNDFLFTLYSGISNSVLSPLFLQAVGITFIGLAMAIGASFLSKPEETD